MSKTYFGMTEQEIRTKAQELGIEVKDLSDTALQIITKGTETPTPKEISKPKPKEVLKEVPKPGKKSEHAFGVRLGGPHEKAMLLMTQPKETPTEEPKSAPKPAQQEGKKKVKKIQKEIERKKKIAEKTDDWIKDYQKLDLEEKTRRLQNLMNISVHEASERAKLPVTDYRFEDVENAIRRLFEEKIK